MKKVGAALSMAILAFGLTPARSEEKTDDLKALDALSPLAFAENAAHLRVFIFHGDADPVVPVTDSRRMVERFRDRVCRDRDLKSAGKIDCLLSVCIHKSCDGKTCLLIGRQMRISHDASRTHHHNGTA